MTARGVWGTGTDRRRSRARTLGVLGVGALLLPSLFPPKPLLVWNTSESAPVGLYLIGEARAPASGDMVLARVPGRFRRLAAERRYLPANVPLVKRVAAVPGDTVCAVNASIVINGKVAAVRAAHDARGRSMPWWNGCMILDERAYFLLTDHPRSFDGRYFGPTPRADILGAAAPAWLH